MKLSVRPITETDIPGAAALAADVFRFAYCAAFTDTVRFDRYVHESFEPGRFEAQLRVESVECLVGHVGDELAGILKLASTERPAGVDGFSCVELSKLYVRERFHGTGIARSLLDRAMRIAADRGFDAMWLCVWERNPRAQAFYRKAGFEIVDEVVIPMDGLPFRDLIMRAAVSR